MKKLLSALSALVLIAAFQANAETIDVKVQGMVCGFCAQGIEKKFSSLPAVESVKVSLESKGITLKIKDKATLKDEEIRDILLDAGYNTSGIERKP